jgi:hypothetical protein
MFNPLDVERLYNPWSINNFFAAGKIKSYWGMAQMSTWLLKSLTPRVVGALISAREVPLDANLLMGADAFAADSTADQTALLVHSGDLTIRGGAASDTEWTAHVPNREVALVAIPNILKRLYQLDIGANPFFGSNTAMLLASGDVRGVMTEWGRTSSRTVGTRIPSSDKPSVHAYEETITGAIAACIAFVALKHPALSCVVFPILSQAIGRENDRGGVGYSDLVWSTRTHDGKYASFLCELAMVDVDATEGVVNKVAEVKTTQVRGYLEVTRKELVAGGRGEVVRTFVVVFDRDGKHRLTREVR